MKKHKEVYKTPPIDNLLNALKSKSKKAPWAIAKIESKIDKNAVIITCFVFGILY